MEFIAWQVSRCGAVKTPTTNMYNNWSKALYIIVENYYPVELKWNCWSQLTVRYFFNLSNRIQLINYNTTL